MPSPGAVLPDHSTAGLPTIALVESPAQLLNVIEWAHSAIGSRTGLRVVVLGPKQSRTRLQMHRMVEWAATAGIIVDWCEVRRGVVSSVRGIAGLSEHLRRAERLVLGDPYSRFIQVLMSLSPAREVVVVDDGSATIEFAEQWSRGERFVRWHSKGATVVNRPLADLARRRLQSRTGTRLQLFTAMPVPDLGPAVVRNQFAWTRARFADPVVEGGADIIGTSLVETGVVDLTHYLRAVRILATNHHANRYYAHRKESTEKLQAIAALGLEVIRADLPLELHARRGPVSRLVISFPSTVVHTLPLVLAGTGVQVSVCDIEHGWFTERASARSGNFLTTVTGTARATHGLAAVLATA